MSVDVSSSPSHPVISPAHSVDDDLMQFLMKSDDVRTVSSTPPRHRRRPSRTNLVVDAQLTHRERTPSPCLSVATSSPGLTVPTLDSRSVSPVDIDRAVRTRRPARSRQRSDGPSGCSLRSSSSTGQLLQSVPHHNQPAVKSGSVGDLLLDDATTSLSFTHVQSLQQGKAPSQLQATGNVTEASRSDAGGVSCRTNLDDINTETRDDIEGGYSQSTEKHRQLSDPYVNSASSSSVNHSQPSSSSSSSSSSSAAAAHRQPRLPNDKRTQRPIRVTAGCQRLTNKTSTRHSLMSLSTDSARVLKEFDAIKKLKLFAGLSRTSSKNQTQEGAGKVEQQSKCKKTRPHTHSSTTVSSGTSTGTVNASKSASTNGSSPKRPAAHVTPSSHPANGSTSKAPAARQKTTGSAVGGLKSRKSAVEKSK